MGEGKCVVVVTHTPKKSRAGVNNTQKPSVWLFATSLSAIMEHFLERIALIRHWYKSTQIRKKNKYKSSVLMRHFILNLSLCLDRDLPSMKEMIGAHI